jgi:hypothetical protein
MVLAHGLPLRCENCILMFSAGVISGNPVYCLALPECLWRAVFPIDLPREYEQQVRQAIQVGHGILWYGRAM